MLLIIITILAAGAMLISTVVFAGAARRFVTGETHQEMSAALRSDLSPYSNEWRHHSRHDRRCGTTVSAFPMVVAGTRIEHDRRVSWRRNI